MSEEAVPFEQPDPKVLKVWLISSLISYAVMVLFLGLPIAVVSLTGLASKSLLWLPVLPVLLWGLTALVLRKTWKLWGYRITPRTVEIRKGLMWRSYRIVARNRIQHIDINSGPLDRRFGLVQVVI